MRDFFARDLNVIEWQGAIFLEREVYFNEILGTTVSIRGNNTMNTMMKKNCRQCLVAVLLGAGSMAAWAESMLMIYPAAGQSLQQQKQDQYNCHNWSVQQSGYDPSNPPAQTSGQGSGATAKGLLKGGARGAAMGAAIGAIAGDAGKGAAIGATAGGMGGGHEIPQSTGPSPFCVTSRSG